MYITPFSNRPLINLVIVRAYTHHLTFITTLITIIFPPKSIEQQHSVRRQLEHLALIRRHQINSNNDKYIYKKKKNSRRPIDLIIVRHHCPLHIQNTDRKSILVISTGNINRSSSPNLLNRQSPARTAINHYIKRNRSTRTNTTDNSVGTSEIMSNPSNKKQKKNKFATTVHRLLRVYTAFS